MLNRTSLTLAGLALAASLAGGAGAMPPGPDSGLTWRGAWACGDHYATGDVVSYAGSSWVTTVALEGRRRCLEPGTANGQSRLLAGRGHRSGE